MNRGDMLFAYVDRGTVEAGEFLEVLKGIIADVENGDADFSDFFILTPADTSWGVVLYEAAHAQGAA